MAFLPIAPNTVFVAKLFEIRYADAMRGLRVRLDHQKIQTAGFRIVTGSGNGFEIVFSNERDALAFRGFEWFRY